MALTPKAAAAQTANGHDFEDDTTDMGGAETSQADAKSDVNARVAAATAKASAAAKPAAETKPAAQASASTAVAATKPASNAVATISQSDPFKELENAIAVEWNTLPRVVPTNGNFQNKETNQLMGDTIALEVLSLQEHYVVSPGGDINDDEAKPFIKYSDDGITTREGLSVKDAVQAAVEAGYTKASCKKRMIMVGAVLNGGKVPEMVGELVQIDMAPNTMKNFQQFRLSNAYKLSKGLKTVSSGNLVELFAIVKSQNKMNWTEAGFRDYVAK